MVVFFYCFLKSFRRRKFISGVRRKICFLEGETFKVNFYLFLKIVDHFVFVEVCNNGESHSVRSEHLVYEVVQVVARDFFDGGGCAEYGASQVVPA